jgi:hypothetical protein
VGEDRRWTLETAQQMFPEVRDRTERAVRQTESLMAERDALTEQAPERAGLDERIQQEVHRWAREMEALGVAVKGLWLVDFDSGSGYYCWKWPEERLEYFHTYEEGFAGRIRIQ